MARRANIDPLAHIVHEHSVLSDVVGVLGVDFDVVDGGSFGAFCQEFQAAGGSVGQEQAFSVVQVSSRNEFLSVFAPEGVRSRGAQRGGGSLEREVPDLNGTVVSLTPKRA